MNKNIPFEFNNFTGVKTLLIIEDDESVCDFLKKYLMRTFFANELLIFYATDGKSGIKIAREIPQDLIILDMVLNVGMDGMAVYKELINDPRTNRSKFIFISGNFEFKSKQGIFFKKPVDMTKFVDKIEELIGLKKIQRKKAVS
ncbi:MAG: response regulator [Desulfobacterales bacterium]